MDFYLIVGRKNNCFHQRFKRVLLLVFCPWDFNSVVRTSLKKKFGGKN